MGPRSRTPNRSSTSTPYTKTTAPTKSTGRYNRNFLQNLIDYNIFPPGYRESNETKPIKPSNWEEIQQRLLRRRRSSLSLLRFSEEEHERFVQMDNNARKEQHVRESVISIIEGHIEIGDGRCRSGSIPLTNLDNLTNVKLMPSNPDIYYGALPKQLDRRIRDELSGQIITSTQHDLPLAPNFFLTAKGPGSSLEVATNQALYDGTLGARGMHSLQSYKQDEWMFNRQAATVTSIYYGGTLKMYTIHRAPPTNSQGWPEYYMHQLKAWAMTSDVETFRRGATAYRNARDWAKEQRDGAIKQANERVDRS